MQVRLNGLYVYLICSTMLSIAQELSRERNSSGQDLGQFPRRIRRAMAVPASPADIFRSRFLPAAARGLGALHR